MRMIWIQMLIELRSLRINRLSLAITALVLPIAYSGVAILTQPVSSWQISYLLSGSLIASLMSSVFFLTVIRTSNLFQAEVLELHAAFPIRRIHQVLGAWLASSLISLPLAGILFGLCILWAPSPEALPALLGLILSYAMVIVMATGLGLLVRNPYKAQGILSIVAWLMVLISPMQQDMSQVPTPLRFLLLINPVTHALNMVRPFLGFDAVLHPAISFAFSAAMLLIVTPLLVRAIRRVTILEKFF